MNGNLRRILYEVGTGERHAENMLESDMQQHSFFEQSLLFASVY